MPNPMTETQEMLDLVQRMNQQVFESIANNDQRNSSAERLAAKAAEDLQFETGLAELLERISRLEVTVQQIDRNLVDALERMRLHAEERENRLE